MTGGGWWYRLVGETDHRQAGHGGYQHFENEIFF